MPLSFDLEKNVGSKHLWVIYISRPHCHFVKTGAHISFKARPGLQIRKWGLRMVFKQDTLKLNWDFNYAKELPSRLRNRLHIDHVKENQRWTISGLKIQLPYNWLVTEKEEIENMEAKGKEHNLSIIGLGQPLLEHRPSCSSFQQT